MLELLQKKMQKKYVKIVRVYVPFFIGKDKFPKFEIT